jgi:hypothetical protein
MEDLKKYKIAIAPMQAEKIKPGDSYWSTFNGSFQNKELEDLQIAANLYDGHPITTWHKDNWRSGENYLLGQHIGIDFDTGDKRSAIATLLDDKFISQYANIVYTTPSHTEEEPRTRAIFLLDEPIHQPKNYVSATMALLFIFRTADKKCKDPVRFFYGGRPGYCKMEYIGKVLPLSIVKHMIKSVSVAQPRKKKSSYTASTTDEQQIQDALKHINPWSIDYDEWLTVLMAIHSALPNGSGLSMADAWAQGHDGEVERKWKGFKTNGNVSGQVTVASLFAIAKQHGYTIRKTAV